MYLPSYSVGATLKGKTLLPQILPLNIALMFDKSLILGNVTHVC